MHKWEKYYHEYDPQNPTFSSSLLDKINKSLKNNSKTDPLEEDLSFFRASKNAKSREEEKMSSLRRACLVEKWMEKKVNDKVTRTTNSKPSHHHTLLEEFDVHDTMFFSTTSTSSSSSAETDYNISAHRSKQKPRVMACVVPPALKSVRTQPIESKYLERLEDNDSSAISSKSRSRAVKIYSNLKNLKQPISPGVRLTSFINSLFTKDHNNDKKKNKNKSKYNNKSSSNINNVTKSEKFTSYSTCTTPSSYSRSCLSSTKKKFQEDGTKRTVRFCPVSVILDEDSRPCGHKSLLKENNDRNVASSNFARSLSKRYEELKMLNSLEKESDRKKLEEVALDLLSGYWDSRLSKSHNHISKDKVNYGFNYGGNYDQHEDEANYDDDDDGDGLSCTSSDLFELDHLSLIGNELPVYETTQFDPKRM